MDMEGMGGLHLHLEYGSMGGRWDIVGDRGRYREVDQQRTTLTLTHEGPTTMF